ncbi:MAG: hypothetical protein FWF26_02100, partial [Treponema sp.]|nr:hypothetical protein [Treponema sp.]
MNDNLILTIIEKFSSGAIGELDLDDGSTHLILRNAEAAIKRNDSVPAGSDTAALPQGKNTIQGKSMNREDNREDDLENSEGITHGGKTAIGKNEGEKITSPIVATYYSSPGPDAPAFVKAGS